MGSVNFKLYLNLDENSDAATSLITFVATLPNNLSFTENYQKAVFLYLGVKFLSTLLVLGVDVLGWVVVFVLGAGWGVLGCLTAGPDITWVALDGRLLDRGRICNTAHRQKQVNINAVRDHSPTVCPSLNHLKWWQTSSHRLD